MTNVELDEIEKWALRHSAGYWHENGARKTIARDVSAIIAEVRRLQDIIGTTCGTEEVTIGEITIRGLTLIQVDEVNEAFAQFSGDFCSECGHLKEIHGNDGCCKTSLVFGECECAFRGPWKE